MTAHPGERTPALLNVFGLWVAMMIGLTVVNYGYPIAQLALLKDTSVPAIRIGGP
jgi:cytochrome c oxidase subunit 1